MPQFIPPNLIKQDDGTFLYMAPTGQIVPVPPQVAQQIHQQTAGTQISSLQAQPKSAGESIIGSIGKGIDKGFNGDQDPFSTTTSTDSTVKDKLLQALGITDAPLQGGITSQIPALSDVPSFGLDATPELSIGFAPEATAATSVIPEAGASIIPDALPATLEAPTTFSLGAEGAAVPAAEGGMFSLGGIGSAGNAILPAAGALGGINLAMSQADAPSGGNRNMRGLLQGGASGAAVGSYFGPVGAAIGGGIGALGGLAGSYFGSSKGERQMTRDQWRKSMMGKGLFDDNYQGTLADNTAFDFGKDKFGFGTNEGDIDLSKPAVGRAAAWGNALAGLSGYGGGKGKEAISAQFTKASTANLKDPNNINTVKDNYKHFLSQMGINNLEQGQRTLDQQSAQGMSQSDWGMMQSALSEIYGNTPTGFDKSGNWVGTSSPASTTKSNNGSPGRRPKK